MVELKSQKIRLKEGWFWFSPTQSRIVPLNSPRNFALIKGDLFEYTEWKDDDSKPNWPDAIFLGYGEFHHTQGGY